MTATAVPQREYTTEAAASLLGFTAGTLRKWRYLGKGPVYVKDDGEQGDVRYLASDLAEWQQSRRVVPGAA